MTLRPLIAWRVMAALLWICSIVCLFRAVSGGVTAEESLYNPHLTDNDRLSIREARSGADHLADVGWLLQIATAAVLSLGMTAKRVVRRIFVALGVVIAADGILLLLTTIFIRIH